MSVLPSDEQNLTIGGSVDMLESRSRLKAGLVGVMFATLAGTAMAGWLYLIGKLLWACVGWLSF
jgi:hypothetical protein